MKRGLLLILIAMAAISGAQAQSAPSEFQQRLACMGDAIRLCPQALPDRERIRLCMAAQRDALSPGCRPVFDASMKALMAARRTGKP